MSQAPEIWRPVIGFEGRYEVSDLGRVRSSNGRILVQAPSGGKRRCYLTVGLSRPGLRKKRTVHCMVLESFVGLRPGGMYGAHSDGDTFNNRLTNLRWATWQENEDDKVRHGTKYHGEKAWCAKLTVDSVFEIRSSPETGVALAKKFGVTPQKVSQIRTGRSWRHV